ncbi:MAG TPA: hypothetical protein VL003_08105 [Pusillimonas sp.]|uniref:hypothetical protein n=1 Tax=Pusillimonas sp. TaxID=3040095 RepID=UPI002B954CC2|nr:hypothetical protein [Pusillimonas sp.]HUH88004.1 hypothetical protein [Pusillimonas sp.]
MKYTFQKIFVTFVSSIFILIGAGQIIMNVSRTGAFDISRSFLGVAFLVIGLISLISSWRRISKYQNKNYAWYKSTYPQHVQGNKVSCFSCGNTRIHARGLKNHSYTREHFCTQCGQTLYHSPES